jgi:amino acid adenylation domain-containing protein
MQKNILEYLFNTVEKYSTKTAVIEENNSISFGDLNFKAKVLANEIIKKQDSINQPIAVFLPKSINSIISDIAITYSGNIYMNLDVKSPSKRIQNIIELIQPKIIITNSKYIKILNEIDSNNILINLDEINFNEVNLVDSSRLEKIIDTDPYCIINTSGSTGVPKGVVLNHKSFIDFTENSLDIFKFSDNEIIGSLSPSVFDIYSFELCMLMAKGSTILLIPETLSSYPIEILNLLQKHNVTFLFWVPTIMVNIANMDLLASVSLPQLKTVWFAGEVFPTKQFNYWRKYLPLTKFANLYGPIEITLDCTYFIVDRDIKDEEPLPIGIPYRNTDILILNESDQLIKEGEEGELCVRGTSLAMGYYNNPEKTSLAFTQNPLNKSYPEIIYRTGDVVSINEFGEIIFKGRKDNLIKHIGYRIDLGEIEHVIINVLKLIENGCVVYNNNKKEITLFYESINEIPLNEFRKQISTILPKYMIPTSYIKMDELPRNTNGKIDRLYLKNIFN